MAVGEPAGGPDRPRRVVSSSAAARRAAPAAAPATPDAPADEDVIEAAPLIKEADPEFERLLAEEEEIERSTRASHETPHFRMGDD